MFKQKCNDFLDAITSLRTTAINEAVNKALATTHAKYVEELTSAKNSYIAEEREKTQAKILALQAELDRKVVSCTKETEMAITTHKEKIVEDAKVKASAEYDNFILGVSKLVDSTHIN